jgi:hypothetical protein
MHETLRQVGSPLQAPSCSTRVLAVAHADPPEHLVDARFERRAVEAVEVPLVPHVLAHGELAVEARRLEHHADPPAHGVGLGDDVVARDRPSREGARSVLMIRKRVVFPPPFGPSNPKISPLCISNEVVEGARLAVRMGQSIDGENGLRSGRPWVQSDTLSRAMSPRSAGR